MFTLALLPFAGLIPVVSLLLLLEWLLLKQIWLLMFMLKLFMVGVDSVSLLLVLELQRAWCTLETGALLSLE